jgi:hypothetical protein
MGHDVQARPRKLQASERWQAQCKGYRTSHKTRCFGRKRDSGEEATPVATVVFLVTRPVKNWWQDVLNCNLPIGICAFHSRRCDVGAMLDDVGFCWPIYPLSLVERQAFEKYVRHGRFRRAGQPWDECGRLRRVPIQADGGDCWRLCRRLHALHSCRMLEPCCQFAVGLRRRVARKRQRGTRPWRRVCDDVI